MLQTKRKRDTVVILAVSGAQKDAKARYCLVFVDFRCFKQSESTTLLSFLLLQVLNEERKHDTVAIFAISRPVKAQKTRKNTTKSTSGAPKHERNGQF